METIEWKRALTVGRAAVLVPTSYSTSILSPPIVHLTRLFPGLGGADDKKEALEGAQKLDETKRQLKSARQRSEELETRFSQVNGANRKRATDLATLRSSAALLSELQLRTPEKVQIKSVQLSDMALQVKGVAVEPMAFARINALQLSLQQSPLLAKDISLIKAERLPPIAKPLTAEKAANPSVLLTPTSVSFELNAPLATLKPKQKVAVLRVLGAEGMAGRLELLEREGLLQ